MFNRCVSGGKQGGFVQEVFGGLACPRKPNVSFRSSKTPKRTTTSDADESYLAVPTSMEGILQRAPSCSQRSTIKPAPPRHPPPLASRLPCGLWWQLRCVRLPRA